MRPYYEDGLATIYHGDWREVLPCLEEPVELVLADPPYGMDNNCDYQRFTGGHMLHSRSRGGMVHERVEGDAEPFDPSPWLEFPRVILWGSNHYAARLPVGSTLVWIKRFDGAFGTFLSDAEVAWMKGGHGVYCHRDTSLNGEPVRLSGTEKPVGLMKWCIKRAGGEGLILDPYMGSGPVLRAAKDMRRRAIGIELKESLCEKAARRMRQEVLVFEEEQ